MENIEFKPCPKCKGKNGNLPEGYIYIPGNAAKECECHKKWTQEHQAEALFKHYGFNSELIDYNPRNYAGEKSLKSRDRLLNYVNNFPKDERVRSCVLYMYGPNGTQKTTLANWAALQLIKQGYVVRYTLMKNLINDLKEADFKEDVKAKVDKMNEADLLVIDESFDKDKCYISASGYALGFIDTFIRDRIQRLNKGIIFISNVAPTEIMANKFSASIQDFIVRETVKYNSSLQFLDNYIASANLEYDPSQSLF